MPPDKKKKDIAAEFGIPSSTLSTIASLRNAEDEDSNDDDVGDELPMVTYNHACSAFETLRSFFLRSSQSNGIPPPYALLGRLDTELMKYHSNVYTQTLITNYIHVHSDN